MEGFFFVQLQMRCEVRKIQYIQYKDIFLNCITKYYNLLEDKMYECKHLIDLTLSKKISNA